MANHLRQIGRRMLGLTAAAGLVLLWASCSTPKADGTPAAAGAPVKVVHPSTTTLVESMEFNANTTFLKKEIVRSTFQGFVESTNKNIGDRVSKGEVILSLKTKEGAAADSAAAYTHGAHFPGSVAVTAKSSGVLSELNYHTGDYVAEGEQLAVISNPSSLAVLLNIPYQDASKIRLHAACTVILPTGKRIAGTIANSLPSVDPVSQTQTFLIRCADLTDLPTNLNLVVKIPVREVRNAIVVPKRSLQGNETLDSFWIMKLADDSTAVKVPVVKGTESDSLIQILSPALNMNDRILIEGGYGLPDTARVSIEN
jgi:biotin carboxyl carrier protein